MAPSRTRYYSIGRRPSAPTSDLIKPGIYGASPSPRSVTFAPNVTPTTYKESDDFPLDPNDVLSLRPDAQLFPPSEQPPDLAQKRRAPPGKRRSLGYIPRPPNAFMLFRADFVRQKHVPGSIETNHGSLSKIIGNCWRSLPLEEKRVWEIKAKQEKEAHSKRYPGYRFKPVHNKSKDKKKAKATPTPEDEQRCEDVAQLLLEGIKGDQLAAAIRRLDERKLVLPAPLPFYPPRRPSSVPLPDSRFHPIALPSIPFFAQTSRSASPVNNISRSARMLIGQRRPSSALPHFGRTSWGVDDIPLFPASSFYPPQSSLQRDESPLPEVNASLFDQTFNFAFSAGSGEPVAMTFNDIFTNVPPHAASASSPSYISPQDISLSLDMGYLTPSQMDLQQAGNAASWMTTAMEIPSPEPSSTYSGSPAQSDLGLPLIAPRPQHAPAGATFDIWHDFASCHVPEGKLSPSHIGLATQHLGLPAVAIAGLDACANQQMHIPGFDMLFESTLNGMEAF
ncbi:hypothetical protein JVT61DRAFT_14308 [Boletus reticuloceps]|uniref:HMG box domain-containing protein n=1 Tax=Boletus reticuloceps TaxID=495285 RepID=A0A8I2YCM8_9AGAM|nr:hypothetical protein JVT61DRAFT_14308 [Boletus reticuloceps]